MATSAILFDFNGVLVDDEALHRDALVATLAEYGIAVDGHGYTRDFLGVDDRESVRRAFRAVGHVAGDGLLVEAVARKHEHYVRACLAGVRWVPGAQAFVQAAFEEGYRLAIVSGALRREIAGALEQAGVAPLFDLVVAAEDVDAGKPSPAGYLRARTALGVPAARTIIIEDSLPGIAAARAARTRCVALATSHARAELEEADLVWNDFEGHAPGELPWAHAVR